MQEFNLGEIWWAKFPYEDNPEEYTIRPVVVLSGTTVGILSVKVTKHAPRDFDPYDTPIIYWSEAGLKLASTARVSKTMILAPERFKEKIGRLVDDDIQRIETMYQKFISEK